MIIVDTALEKREKEGKPVRVGLIGAGYMGRGIALQFLSPINGMRLVAISNRTISEAERAYRQAGVDTLNRVESVAELENSIHQNKYSVTDNASLLCEAEGIDAIIEATGEIEFGVQHILKAIENKKHVILMNAELDATIGPILKTYADRAGVVITNTDGDEPGVAMNLIRFVRGSGFKPLMAGNLKGMIDRYRTPETQRVFAEKYKQKPKLITSFADGTKLSMETTVLANGAGFKVAKRGMLGLSCDHVKDTLNLFSMDLFEKGGLVDYIVGAEPHTGAFVLCYNDNPIKQQYMNYFKMGEGPLYCFYTPFHLPHVQIASTVARAVLFNDPTVTPIGKPQCDVLTVAKRDLKKGEILDGIGGFTSYGLIENAENCHKEKLLPMGLSETCTLLKDIPKDQAISYDDVNLPPNRICDKLRAEQNRYFHFSV